MLHTQKADFRRVFKKVTEVDSASFAPTKVGELRYQRQRFWPDGVLVRDSAAPFGLFACEVAVDEILGCNPGSESLKKGRNEGVRSRFSNILV